MTSPSSQTLNGSSSPLWSETERRRQKILFRNIYFKSELSSFRKDLEKYIFNQLPTRLLTPLFSPKEIAGNLTKFIKKKISSLSQSGMEKLTILAMFQITRYQRFIALCLAKGKPLSTRRVTKWQKKGNLETIGQLTQKIATRLGEIAVPPPSPKSGCFFRPWQGLKHRLVTSLLCSNKYGLSRIITPYHLNQKKSDPLFFKLATLIFEKLESVISSTSPPRSWEPECSRNFHRGIQSLLSTLPNNLLRMARYKNKFAFHTVNNEVNSRQQMWAKVFARNLTEINLHKKTELLFASIRESIFQGKSSNQNFRKNLNSVENRVCSKLYNQLVSTVSQDPVEPPPLIKRELNDCFTIWKGLRRSVNLNISKVQKTPNDLISSYKIYLSNGQWTKLAYFTTKIQKPLVQAYIASQRVIAVSSQYPTYIWTKSLRDLGVKMRRRCTEADRHLKLLDGIAGNRPTIDGIKQISIRFELLQFIINQTPEASLSAKKYLAHFALRLWSTTVKGTKQMALAGVVRVAHEKIKELIQNMMRSTRQLLVDPVHRPELMRMGLSLLWEVIK